MKFMKMVFIKYTEEDLYPLLFLFLHLNQNVVNQNVVNQNVDQHVDQHVNNTTNF